MKIRTPDGLGNLVLRFSQKRISFKRKQDSSIRHRVPGSWNSLRSRFDGIEYWEDIWRRYPKKSIDGTSFFIGLLIEGVREFGRYDKIDGCGHEADENHETVEIYEWIDENDEETDESCDDTEEEWESASEGS